MTTALAYLRVSSRAQIDGDGFERQRIATGSWANLNDVTILETYRDEGVSGTAPLADRPGLLALFERISSNGIRLVLVEKSDRLARDLIEGELILREFRRLGVRVIECEGGHDLTNGTDNPTATLIRQVLGAVAEFEKSALVGKLRASRVRARRSGKRVEGRRPFYGPEIAELAQRLRDEGMSYREIALELDARGIPTRQGRPWHENTVRYLLVETKVPRDR